MRCKLDHETLGPLQDIVGVPGPDRITVQVRVMVDTPAMPLGLVGETDTDETVIKRRGC